MSFFHGFLLMGALVTASGIVVSYFEKITLTTVHDQVQREYTLQRKRYAIIIGKKTKDLKRTKTAHVSTRTRPLVAVRDH